MEEARGVVHGEVSYQHTILFEAILLTIDDRETKHAGAPKQLPEDPYRSP